MHGMRANPTALAEVLAMHLPALTAPYTKYCGRIPEAQALYGKKVAEEPDFVKFETDEFPGMSKPTLNYIMRSAFKLQFQHAG
jgi:hypothetical protein